MRSSTRIFLVTIALILLLAGGAAYLLTLGNSAEFNRRVLTVFGGAIGAIAGSMLFLAASLRLKGR